MRCSSTWLRVSTLAVVVAACSNGDGSERARTTPPSAPRIDAAAAPRAPLPADAMPDATPSDAAVPDAVPGPRWTWGQLALVEMHGTEVPWGEHGEVTLLAFSHDPYPVEAWRYDECVAAKACAARSVAQPSGDRDEPAVGMTWPHAADYCATRGLSTLSGPQDAAIARTDRDPSAPLLARDPNKIVVYGFRCGRTDP